MLAADGRCKTLDVAADGYVRAEACTAFLLAALAAPVAGADECVPSAAVCVSASAVNQDGRSSSLTAPNGPSQQATIRAALQSGSAAAPDVGLLELHGTGTALGDPIEVGAAVAVLHGSARQRPLVLSAAKSRVGHAETGAGTLGMLHAWRQLQQVASSSNTHLRSVNQHVASCLESSSGTAGLPRQASPGVHPAGGIHTGISSFAFQVRHC